MSVGILHDSVCMYVCVYVNNDEILRIFRVQKVSAVSVLFQLLVLILFLDITQQTIHINSHHVNRNINFPLCAVV